MKKIIYSLIILLASSLSVYAVQDSTIVSANDIEDKSALVSSSTYEADNDSVRLAVTAYDEGDFYTSIGLLEREISRKKDQGQESADLYYNLGNAYFRVNELGHARLNYERAAILAPNDRDIEHNIEYVKTRLENKILEVDSFFLSVWFNAVQNWFRSDVWAGAGIIVFILFMVCLVAFFFSRRIQIKKISFYAGLVFLVLVIFFNIFAYRQKQKIIDRKTAVIMAPSVSVVSSPDINSKELFRLHVGTKVSITKTNRSWLEIELDNGSVGWIQRDKLEII